MTSRFQLRLHDEPLEVDQDGIPRIGCRGLVVRDDAGRKLDVEFLAWGQLGTVVAGAFQGVELEGQANPSDEAIVLDAKLDAGADYLMILVRCDHAERR